jgi:hypothetical protein
VHRVRTRDGAQVDVRPIEPRDKDVMRDGFARLSPESRYERFLSPLDQLSNSMLRYFTAMVLARNEDMIDMLFRLGPAKVVDRSNGTVQIEAELPPTGVSDQLRGLLRMAAEMTKRFRPEP